MNERNHHTPLDVNVTTITHIVERLPDPNWKISQSVTSRYYVLGFALDGEADYVINGKSFLIQKGDLVFITDAVQRSAHSHTANPWHYITISFDLDFYDEDSKKAILSLPHVMTSVPPQVFTLAQELNRTWTGRGLGYLLKSRSLISDILCELVLYEYTKSYKPEHYKKILLVQNYILEHYQMDFHVTELSRMAGLSESHFRKLFRSMTGMTSIQYIHLIKINKARDLIQSGSSNVSEAAEATGFKDIFYFSRLFKSVTGHPPSYYKDDA